MADQLGRLLDSDPKAKEYFETLPQYAREAVRKHAEQIDGVKSMRLLAESYMKDDSYRGA
ncbi:MULTISPECIES: hypothetical protein [Caproicibacter]|uniref:Uncharacterized protein n=1 Tax=Caproicibacter fermentans TaxID=2576756 RepID=A0A7G8TEQ5_9FIRM|nr:hypothetical protein [Caproicibacter fermentans]OCN00260.1 hypothetical protein A7X67_09340 [Clostridium sp. W14A]QNK42096.1 hypothetical protein HCR03_07695 [Caproicibacter fermentans]